MGKKWTLELIKQWMKENITDIELLSDKYINNRKSLVFKCNNGHEFKRTWSNFHGKNQKCPKCEKENRTYYNIMPIDKVVKFIKSKRFEILEGIETYLDGKSEFHLKCLKGHSFKKTLANFKNNSYCPYCSCKAIPTLEDRLNEFKKKDLILLPHEYINKNTKLPYICPIHPNKIRYITWDKIHNSNQGCSLCGDKIISEKMMGENNHQWLGGITKLEIFLKKKYCSMEKRFNNK